MLAAPSAWLDDSSFSHNDLGRYDWDCGRRSMGSPSMAAVCTYPRAGTRDASAASNRTGSRRVSSRVRNTCSGSIHCFHPAGRNYGNQRHRSDRCYAVRVEPYTLRIASVEEGLLKLRR